MVIRKGGSCIIDIIRALPGEGINGWTKMVMSDLAWLCGSEQLI